MTNTFHYWLAGYSSETGKLKSITGISFQSVISLTHTVYTAFIDTLRSQFPYVFGLCLLRGQLSFLFCCGQG